MSPWNVMFVSCIMGSFWGQGSVLFGWASHILPNGQHIADWNRTQPYPEMTAAADLGALDDAQTYVILAFGHDPGSEFCIEEVEAFRALPGRKEAPFGCLSLGNRNKRQLVLGAILRSVDGLAIVCAFRWHLCGNTEIHSSVRPVGNDVMLPDRYVCAPGECFQLFVGGYHSALSGISL